MAGEGKRFKDKGFLTPKPLIEINGIHMVIRALNSLPKADKNILIVRKNQFDISSFKKKLNNYFKNIYLIVTDHLSEGQASSCLLAEDCIPNNSILNISSCDIAFNYDKKKYHEFISKYDSFIWTYKNTKLLEKPEDYGWIKTFKNSNKVKYVSCKKPLKNDTKGDYIVSGAFTFKNSNDFFRSAKKMIKKNDRVNNEFYVDNIFNHNKLNNSVFEVKKYFSWGTPKELKLYLNNEI